MQTKDEPKPSMSVTDTKERDGDDDIEIINEVKPKPLIPNITVGMRCYAVKHGDLWKKAIITAETPSSSNPPGKVTYDQLL